MYLGYTWWVELTSLELHRIHLDRVAAFPSNAHFGICARPSSAEWSTTMAATKPFTCEICFDDVPAVADSAAEAVRVVRICGPQCPAQICSNCLKQHVRTALNVSYTGALPRVRCPICLVQLNREQWARRLREGDPERKTLLQTYRRVSLRSCNFRAPCCHNSRYIHMPTYHTTKLCTRYERHALSTELNLPDDRKAEVFAKLRALGQRFCRHDKEVTARDLVRCIEDNVSQEKVEAAFALVASRIRDEERRATLVLAFYRQYPRTRSRCCGHALCFNCKRSLPNNEMDKPCICETDSDDDINLVNCVIECRGCRAMIVKSEGCSDVVCPCGFVMHWPEELDLRDKITRKLLPATVDPFDTSVYSAWTNTKYKLLDSFQKDFRQIEIVLALRGLTRAGRVVVQSALRRLIWRRRFQKLVRESLTAELRRHSAIRSYPSFINTLRRFIWRRRFDKVVTDVRRGYQERAEKRRAAKRCELLRKLNECPTTYTATLAAFA